MHGKGRHEEEKHPWRQFKKSVQRGITVIYYTAPGEYKKKDTAYQYKKYNSNVPGKVTEKPVKFLPADAEHNYLKLVQFTINAPNGIYN